MRPFRGVLLDKSLLWENTHHLESLSATLITDHLVAGGIKLGAGGLVTTVLLPVALESDLGAIRTLLLHKGELLLRPDFVRETRETVHVVSTVLSTVTSEEGHLAVTCIDHSKALPLEDRLTVANEALVAFVSTVGLASAALESHDLSRELRRFFIGGVGPLDILDLDGRYIIVLGATGNELGEGDITGHVYLAVAVSRR
jgi:hypothetical protein